MKLHQPSFSTQRAHPRAYSTLPSEPSLSALILELQRYHPLESAKSVLESVSLPAKGWTIPLVDERDESDLERQEHASNLLKLRDLWNTSSNRPDTTTTLAIATSAALIDEFEIVDNVLLHTLTLLLSNSSNTPIHGMKELISAIFALKVVPQDHIDLLNIWAWSHALRDNPRLASAVAEVSMALYSNQGAADMARLESWDRYNTPNYEGAIEAYQLHLSQFPSDYRYLEPYLSALRCVKRSRLIADVADAFNCQNPKLNLTSRLLLFKINALFDLRQNEQANALLAENPHLFSLDTTSATTLSELLELARIHLRYHTHTPVLSHILNPDNIDLSEDDFQYKIMPFFLHEYKRIPVAAEMLAYPPVGQASNIQAKREILTKKVLPALLPNHPKL